MAPASAPSFALTVEVIDDGTGTLSDTATITINLSSPPLIDPQIVVDDPPDDPDPGDPFDDVIDPPTDPLEEPNVEDDGEPLAEDFQPESLTNGSILKPLRTHLDGSLSGSSSSSDRDAEVELRRQSDRPQETEEQDEVYRLTVLREQVMWDALNTLGDQISADAERREEQTEVTRSRVEKMALALSTGALALLARASSLTALALSSLPVWQRVDPLTVLALSARERKERERELRDAEEQENEAASGLGDLLDGKVEPDPESSPENEDEEDEEDEGQAESPSRR